MYAGSNAGHIEAIKPGVAGGLNRLSIMTVAGTVSPTVQLMIPMYYDSVWYSESYSNLWSSCIRAVSGTMSPSPPAYDPHVLWQCLVQWVLVLQLMFLMYYDSVWYSES